MVVYKLTDADGYCRRGKPGETRYEVGKTYTSDGTGDLCTEHWRHAYEHPVLAVLHDPIHGAHGLNARIWECETGEGKILREGKMKLGTTSITILREIPLPVVTTEQRVAYAIHCALRVYAEESFAKWAEGWLDGTNRTRCAADAEYAAEYAAMCAADAAADAVGYDGYAAMDAAEAAADAARCAVGYAADAAEYAARCAADAATDARRSTRRTRRMILTSSHAPERPGSSTSQQVE